jgi:hypothetical protein
MTMAFDLAFLIYYLYLIVNKNKDIQNILIGGICSISLIVGAVFPILLSKYSIVVQEDGLSLTVTSNEKEYTVPETINGEKVVELVFESNRDYSNIETINISKNLKRVITTTMRTPNLSKINLDEENEYLTSHNELLMDISSNKVYMIPAKLEEITIDWNKVLQRTFYDAENLKVVNFTSDVKMIDDEAFAYCTSLTDVNFTDGLETLGEDTFAYCSSLEEFSLPDSLTYIERGTLRGCTNIKKISFPFLGAKRYDEYLSTNYNVLAYHMGATYNMADIEGLNLEEVNITSQNFLQAGAFYRCNAKTINISINSGNLETNDFYGCGITSFNVPEGVEYIGNSCFQYCEQLAEITLPASLKEIKENAFANCSSLTKVNFAGDASSLLIANGNEIIKSLLNI